MGLIECLSVQHILGAVSLIIINNEIVSLKTGSVIYIPTVVQVEFRID